MKLKHISLIPIILASSLFGYTKPTILSSKPSKLEKKEIKEGENQEWPFMETLHSAIWKISDSKELIKIRTNVLTRLKHLLNSVKISTNRKINILVHIYWLDLKLYHITKNDFFLHESQKLRKILKKLTPKITNPNLKKIIEKI